MFTDIEGSTEMAQRLGSRFHQVIEDHNEILRSAIATNGGTTVSTGGDSFFAAFRDADAAVLAALDAQRRLRSHKWPDGHEVLIRIGAHTGEGRLGAENYVGIDVIVAARISAVANGGQVVVSEATRSHLSERLPPGLESRDLGHHHLKGLEDPKHLFQISHGDLPTEFPPLATQGPPTNLPAQDSLFVGRRMETSEVQELLVSERLVTLYGPGGTGKTRLALHVASRVFQHFESGVHVVRLNTAGGPERVVPSIVEVVGASQLGEPVEAVIERVGSKSWLLILDGFEHLTASAPQLTALLEACERLTLLITSQRRLNTRFERVYSVPPLGVPAEDSLAAVQASDGVSLFLSRVAALESSFVLTEENASQIAEIVAGVDGVPLAIELAAAKVRLLGLARLRDEVNQSISVLSGGFADADDHHHSMDAAIAWSYGSLDVAAQVLFGRCSRFVGGFSLDALEAVCAGEPLPSVQRSMAQLLDSSLVSSVMSAGAGRFRMLEPLRKYGLARIEETGEAGTVARRHADYYTNLVSDAATSIHGPDHYEAIERLILERPNVTAALEWSIDNDPDMGLATLADLAPSFPVIGALADGYQLAERLLNAGGSPHARLSGLLGAGSIAYWLNDYEKAEAHYGEAIELSMAHDEDGFRAEALFGRAFSLVWLGQPEEAEKVADLIARPDDDSSTRMSRGTLALRAFVDWMRGDLEAAGRKLDDAISASHQNGDETAELFYRLALSGISVLTGEIEKAVPVQLAALSRFSDLQDEGGMLHALDWLAQAAIVRNPSQGVILASAVDSLRRRRGGFIDLTRLGMPDPRERALKHMSSVELEKRWAQGRELDLIGARDLALELANGVAASEKLV